MTRSAGRALIIGCCRTARILDALQHVRASTPDAHVTVLIARDRIVELAASRVDEVMTFRGGRLGLLRTPGLARRLRRARFDTVLIPYMVPDDAAHANVLRLASALGVAQTLILRASAVATCSHRDIRRLAMTSTAWRMAGLFEVPALLHALGVAC